METVLEYYKEGWKLTLASIMGIKLMLVQRRLVLICVMPFMEDLTDRQAAEVNYSRIERGNIFLSM